MCGIVGMWRFDGVQVDERLLRLMTAQVAHRGPDGEGYWFERSIGMGHKRLSVIDLAGSHQPMCKSGAVISFNGEIFNYRELRQSLARQGYEFQTSGDTEVLLTLFLADGCKAVEKLDGQFAYAIYEKEKKTLWLFRDRIGILPLYYYYDGGIFLFASEIKALLPAIPDALEVDQKSVKEYLAYRSVPCPHTLFKGVRKLAPGHYLRLESSGDLRTTAYWEIPIQKPRGLVTVQEAIGRLSQGLEQAVSSRLVADVPVGAYLSGGLDSSLIVALMIKLKHGAAVETFSAGFSDPRYDELPFARDVSDRLGTSHHEIVVLPEDFQNLWHKLTWHRDSPLSEPADIALFKLASLARNSVKVLLSGEGSDELFGGYPKYRFARLAGLADLFPVALRKAIFRRSERILPVRLAKMRIMLRAMSAESEADRFVAWFSPFTAYERDILIRGEEREGHVDIWQKAAGDVVQRMLYFDCHTWLVDNLLERGDRMSMAASVESRPPFLDHRLVELAFSIPSTLKVRFNCGKWIVKALARRFLPSQIVDRKKVGFRVPLDLWFRGGILRDMARDLLLSRNSFVASIMDRPFISDLLEVHETGRRDEEMRIWTLLGLEIWHQVFFKGERLLQRQNTAAVAAD